MLFDTLGLAPPAGGFFEDIDPTFERPAFEIPGAIIALTCLSNIFFYPLFGAIGGVIGGMIFRKSTTSTKPETLQDDNAITNSSNANVPGFQSSVTVRRIVAAWLILSQLLALLSLNMWLIIVALAALPLLDSPSPFSMQGLQYSLTLLVPLVLYPLFPIACAIVAWLLYRRGKKLGMVAAVAITSLPIIVPLLVLAWMFLI